MQPWFSPALSWVLLDLKMRVVTWGCLPVVFLSLFMGLSADSFLLIWACMELSFLAFMVLWGMLDYEISGASMMKFFFIQSMSGLVMVITFISVSRLQLGAPGIAALFILLKAGAFPFQGWVLEISEALPCSLLMLFLTTQKVLPLQLISLLTPEHWVVLLSVMSWLVLSSTALCLQTFKKIVVISSTLFTMALLLIVSTTSVNWKALFLIYCLALSPLLLYSCLQSFPESKAALPSMAETWVWTIAIGFLSGIPPLPAFLLKLEIILVLATNSEPWPAGVFLMAGVAMLTLYVSLLLKCLNTSYWVFSTRETPWLSLLMVAITGVSTSLFWA